MTIAYPASPVAEPRVIARAAAAGLALLTLGGCLMVPIVIDGPPPWADPAAAPAPYGQCGAASVQQFVGQPYELLVFPQGTRVQATGAAAADDFDDARLNVEVEPTGLVTRIWCG